MDLLLDRKYKKESYTIGNLYINKEFFCNTIEDKDRGLLNTMSLEEIKSKKISSITAIPRGTYKITLDVISPRFGSRKFYKEVCDGKLPRLLNVKGFEGVLIHCGNSAKDSSGCIIVGKNKIKGGVTESQETFKTLYKKLKDAKDKGELLVLVIA